jgi:hypothetical protein
MDDAIAQWQRTHGGCRQRLANALSVLPQPILIPHNANNLDKSDTVESLGLDWAMGLMTAPQVYRIAKSVTSDIAKLGCFDSINELEQLARIGDGGDAWVTY